MLRLLVLLLVLANCGYFAWSQGFLKAYGYAPTEVGEPQRLVNQIRPDAIRLVRPDELRRIDAAARQPVRAPECLLAGLFDETQTAALRRAVEANLPAGAWELEDLGEAGRWIIYMGKYPNAQALAAKRSELSALNLKYEPLNNAALEPGLSLGTYTSQSAAESALAALTRRGIRTAKVLLERPEVKGWQLKLGAVDEALRARLEDLKPVLAGKSWRACS